MARKAPQVTADNAFQLIAAREMVADNYNLIAGIIGSRLRRRGLQGAAYDDHLADALGECWQRVRSRALRTGCPTIDELRQLAAWAAVPYRRTV